MRNKLQYAYTIAVFIGVLVTSYLMINRDGNGRLPIADNPSPNYRSEATLMDPAVSSLLEMEDALTKFPKEKNEGQKRTPTYAAPRPASD